MTLNQDSIVGFVLRELGYASAFIQNILGLAEKNGPQVEAAVAAVAQVVTTDAAAFQAGTAVTSPAVPASIEGHSYTVTVVFTPVG